MNKKIEVILPIFALPFCTLLGYFRRKKYKSIHTFCCFIGYSRSGHTLVGSLLDAHPNIVIATEANALNLVNRGFGKYSLLFYLEIWSKMVSRFLGNKWTGYDYSVKGANQGDSNSISIIGDKKGSGSLKVIKNNPMVASKLQKIVGYPVKYIHVIRNPYDNIATMHNRTPSIGNTTDQGEVKENRKFSRKVLKKSMRLYFKKVYSIQQLIEKKEMDILNVYHEDLISSPEKTLQSIFDFLGAETDSEFLQNCAKTIYDNPNKSRHSISWPLTLKQAVQDQCNQVPFLMKYSFGN